MITTVFSIVLIMMAYMAIGLVLCKSGLGTPDHAKSMSALLIYVLGPCMIINAFLSTEYSLEALIKLALFFLVTLLIQLLFFVLLFVFFHKKYHSAEIRIMNAASILGNVGFFGLPLITGIFPDEPLVACYSSIFVMSMNVLVFTMGTYMITNDRKYISFKGILLNPTTVAMAIALPLFILGIELPPVLGDGVALLAKMVTPMCMIIAGMRLSTVSLKKLFTHKIIYLTCFFKLIIFPVFAFILVNLIPFVDHTFKVSVFVLASAPSGAIIQSLAELHCCEQEFSANVVLLTTILSVVTIPLMVQLLMMI